MLKKRLFLVIGILFFLSLAIGFWLYTREHFLVIMCAGDSITRGAYPDYLQENLDRAGIKAKVINMGVPGNTSGEYLTYLKSRRVLQEIRPDIVLLELGTNDVRTDGDHTETTRFIANMNQIIDLIHNYGGPPPRILLATVPPIVIDEGHRLHFNEESKRRVVEEINPAIIQITKDRELLLLDVYQLFQQQPGFLPGIHPSQEGYKAMADAWFDRLIPLVTSPGQK